MKKTFLILVLILLSSALDASAYDFVVNSIYYNITGTNTVEVTKEGTNISSYSGNVTIPGSVSYSGKTYWVTAIGSGAFRNCSNLESVTVPNTVTEIKSYAFFDSNLSSVNLGNGVTTIGYQAFDSCFYLDTITLPASLRTLDGLTFQQNDMQKVICLAPTPPTVVYTHHDVFSADTYRNAYSYVPRGSKSAYQSAFGWSSFAYLFELPYDFVVNGIYYTITGSNTVEVSHKEGNSGCYSGNVTIPSSVSYGGKTYAVTGIGNDAFNHSYRLTSVTIPNSVTYIGSDAFRDCNSLKSVTIPNSVTEIKSFAFFDCLALASVTIGSSVTSIKDKAFYGCTVLRDVKCKATTPPTMAAKTVFDDALYTDLDNMSGLTVPMGCRSAYESANWWKDFKVIMEETYDFVVNGFYYRITGDNTVELTTKSEMGKTYSGNVTVPSSVTYGGKTYTVTGIGSICFAWCNLTSLTLPNTITYIGESAFSACSGFGNLTLPNSLTEINAYAFALCTGLTSLVIPNSVTYIGKYAFNYCRYLTNLTLSSNLTNLGKGAFNECSGLTNLTIPGKVTIIQGETFKGCSSLTSVTLGDNVTKIYYDAFKDCSALTSVTIPAKVTLISSDVFNGCTSLTSVNSLAFTPPTIYSSTFTSNHYSGATLTVPYGSRSAYQVADYWKNFSRIVVNSQPGDVNGDGLINITDITVLIDYLLSSDASAIDLSAADCDLNGTVNITDVTALIDRLLNGSW